MNVILASFLGLMVLIAIGSFTCIVLMGRYEENAKARRKERMSAFRALNNIDNIVSQYYPTSDLVGQAMGDEIRAEIHNHRKLTTPQ